MEKNHVNNFYSLSMTYLWIAVYRNRTAKLVAVVCHPHRMMRDASTKRLKIVYSPECFSNRFYERGDCVFEMHTTLISAVCDIPMCLPHGRRTCIMKCDDKIVVYAQHKTQPIELVSLKLKWIDDSK